MFDQCCKCGRSIFAADMGLKNINGKMCITQLPEVEQIRLTDLMQVCHDCQLKHRKKQEANHA